jgi:hypothetical protein
MWHSWKRANKGKSNVWKWRRANKGKPNAWVSSCNSEGLSMKWRVEAFLHAPGHFEFYRENGFGAIIGRSDYMAVVIIDETAVHMLSNALKK